MSAVDPFKPPVRVNQIMHASGFTPADRLAALRWVAIRKNCKTCGAPKGEACRHLTRIRIVGWEKAEIVRNPHEKRISYGWLLELLLKKGYNTSGRKKIR